jgi:hypothetical protein
MVKNVSSQFHEKDPAEACSVIGNSQEVYLHAVGLHTERAADVNIEIFPWAGVNGLIAAVRKPMSFAKKARSAGLT